MHCNDQINIPPSQAYPGHLTGQCAQRDRNCILLMGEYQSTRKGGGYKTNCTNFVFIIPRGFAVTFATPDRNHGGNLEARGLNRSIVLQINCHIVAAKELRGCRTYVLMNILFSYAFSSYCFFSVVIVFLLISFIFLEICNFFKKNRGPQVYQNFCYVLHSLNNVVYLSIYLCSVIPF